MEWVEVRGRTVEVAVEAAMQELGINDHDRVEVEILQQPEKGFLGIGGKDAIVKVKPKPAGKKRRRRRKKGAEAREPRSRDQGKGPKPSQPREARRGGGQGERRREEEKRRPERRQEGPEVSIDQQVPVVEEFLKGLVGAFGLEGEVEVGVDGDTIVAEVKGPQTEAMVGPRGSVIESIHELAKTVLQRKTQASARLRLDIAGYAERRRQALSIYANQLIDQVLEEGGEITLEPMSASDRKVIHDAAAAREGVQTYSEGEAPQRYVVISKVGTSDEEE